MNQHFIFSLLFVFSFSTTYTAHALPNLDQVNIATADSIDLYAENGKSFSLHLSAKDIHTGQTFRELIQKVPHFSVVRAIVQSKDGTGSLLIRLIPPVWFNDEKKKKELEEKHGEIIEHQLFSLPPSEPILPTPSISAEYYHQQQAPYGIASAYPVVSDQMQVPYPTALPMHRSQAGYASTYQQPFPYGFIPQVYPVVSDQMQVPYPTALPMHRSQAGYASAPQPQTKNYAQTPVLLPVPAIHSLPSTPTSTPEELELIKVREEIARLKQETARKELADAQAELKRLQETQLKQNTPQTQESVTLDYDTTDERHSPLSASSTTPPHTPQSETKNPQDKNSPVSTQKNKKKKRKKTQAPQQPIASSTISAVDAAPTPAPIQPVEEKKEEEITAAASAQSSESITPQNKPQQVTKAEKQAAQQKKQQEIFEKAQQEFARQQYHEALRLLSTTKNDKNNLLLKAQCHGALGQQLNHSDSEKLEQLCGRNSTPNEREILGTCCDLKPHKQFEYVSHSTVANNPSCLIKRGLLVLRCQTLRQEHACQCDQSTKGKQCQHGVAQGYFKQALENPDAAECLLRMMDPKEQNEMYHCPFITLDVLLAHKCINILERRNTPEDRKLINSIKPTIEQEEKKLTELAQEKAAPKTKQALKEHEIAALTQEARAAKAAAEEEKRKEREKAQRALKKAGQKPATTEKEEKRKAREKRDEEALASLQATIQTPKDIKAQVIELAQNLKKNAKEICKLTNLTQNLDSETLSLRLEALCLQKRTAENHALCNALETARRTHSIVSADIIKRLIKQKFCTFKEAFILIDPTNAKIFNPFAAIQVAELFLNVSLADDYYPAKLSIVGCGTSTTESAQCPHAYALSQFDKVVEHLKEKEKTFGKLTKEDSNLLNHAAISCSELLAGACSTFKNTQNNIDKARKYIACLHHPVSEELQQRVTLFKQLMEMKQYTQTFKVGFMSYADNPLDLDFVMQFNNRDNQLSRTVTEYLKHSNETEKEKMLTVAKKIALWLEEYKNNPHVIEEVGKILIKEGRELEAIEFLKPYSCTLTTLKKQCAILEKIGFKNLSDENLEHYQNIILTLFKQTPHLTEQEKFELGFASASSLIKPKEKEDQVTRMIELAQDGCAQAKTWAVNHFIAEANFKSAFEVMELPQNPLKLTPAQKQLITSYVDALFALINIAHDTIIKKKLSSDDFDTVEEQKWIANQILLLTQCTENVYRIKPYIAPKKSDPLFQMLAASHTFLLEEWTPTLSNFETFCKWNDFFKGQPLKKLSQDKRLTDAYHGILAYKKGEQAESFSKIQELHFHSAEERLRKACLADDNKTIDPRLCPAAAYYLGCIKYAETNYEEEMPKELIGLFEASKAYDLLESTKELAQSYNAHDHYQKAWDTLEALTPEQDPKQEGKYLQGCMIDHNNTQMFAGQTQEEAKQKAIEYWKKYAPQNHSAMIAISKRLLESAEKAEPKAQEEQIQEAIFYARKAYALMPETLISNLTLAECLLKGKKEQIKEAYKVLIKINRLKPELECKPIHHALANDHLPYLPAAAFINKLNQKDIQALQELLPKKIDAIQKSWATDQPCPPCILLQLIDVVCKEDLSIFSPSQQAFIRCIKEVSKIFSPEQLKKQEDDYQGILKKTVHEGVTNKQEAQAILSGENKELPHQTLKLGLMFPGVGCARLAVYHRNEKLRKLLNSTEEFRDIRARMAPHYVAQIHSSLEHTGSSNLTLSILEAVYDAIQLYGEKNDGQILERMFFEILFSYSNNTRTLEDFYLLSEQTKENPLEFVHTLLKEKKHPFHGTIAFLLLPSVQTFLKLEPMLSETFSSKNNFSENLERAIRICTLLHQEPTPFYLDKVWKEYRNNFEKALENYEQEQTSIPTQTTPIVTGSPRIITLLKGDLKERNAAISNLENLFSDAAIALSGPLNDFINIPEIMMLKDYQPTLGVDQSLLMSQLLLKLDAIDNYHNDSRYQITCLSLNSLTLSLITSELEAGNQNYVLKAFANATTNPSCPSVKRLVDILTCCRLSLRETENLNRVVQLIYFYSFASDQQEQVLALQKLAEHFPNYIATRPIENEKAHFALKQKVESISLDNLSSLFKNDKISLRSALTQAVGHYMLSNHAKSDDLIPLLTEIWNKGITLKDNTTFNNLIKESPFPPVYLLVLLDVWHTVVKNKQEESEEKELELKEITKYIQLLSAQVIFS